MKSNATTILCSWQAYCQCLISCRYILLRSFINIQNLATGSLPLWFIFMLLVTVPVQLVQWCQWFAYQGCFDAHYGIALSPGEVRWYSSSCGHPSPPYSETDEWRSATPSVPWRPLPSVSHMLVGSPLGHIPGSCFQGNPVMCKRVTSFCPAETLCEVDDVVSWLPVGYLVHAGESLRFLASDWLRNGSWARGSVPGGSATVSLRLAI